MKLPNVDESHGGPGYAWVSFARLERRPEFIGFAWREVTDPMILLALNKPRRRLPGVNMEWHYSRLIERATSVAETYQRHADRIAALVRIIESGGGIRPGDLKLLPWAELRDGNHRARAFRWLGYPCFPAYCEGGKTLVNKVVYRGRALDRVNP